MAVQLLQPQFLDRSLKPFGAVAIGYGSPRPREGQLIFEHSVQGDLSVHLDGVPSVPLDARRVVEEVADPELEEKSHLKETTFKRKIKGIAPIDLRASCGYENC